VVCRASFIHLASGLLVATLPSVYQFIEIMYDIERSGLLFGINLLRHDQRTNATYDYDCLGNAEELRTDILLSFSAVSIICS
jgi:hypothetical protein